MSVAVQVFLLVPVNQAASPPHQGPPGFLGHMHAGGKVTVSLGILYNELFCLGDVEKPFMTVFGL